VLGRRRGAAQGMYVCFQKEEWNSKATNKEDFYFDSKSANATLLTLNSSLPLIHGRCAQQRNMQ